MSSFASLQRIFARSFRERQQARLAELILPGILGVTLVLYLFSADMTNFTTLNWLVVGLLLLALALAYRLQVRARTLQHQVASLEEDIEVRTRAEVAVVERERRFRQLAENIRDMFWLRDVSSEYYLYISPAYEEIWGRPPEDLYHNPALMTESIHPDDRKEVLAAMEQLNTRRVFNGEYRIIRADGQVRWIHARVFPVLDEKDEVTRLTGIAEDITERKEAQTALLERERLRMALEKEQEISALRHKLMSTLSHEFRTPLTIVQAAVQMLEVYAERNDAEKHHQRLKVILQQVKQMTEMLDDMSLVVHGTSQYMKFKPQTVEIEQLCRDFIEEMQASIGANHRMAFITDGNVQTLQADPRLLGRILSNLLHNAVKYSPKGAEVRLQLHQEENCLVLRVSDKGIGIPPEEQTHVFEPFFRASNTGDVRGTGLGLRIVKDCVTLHGGSVTFESLPGKGTTFMVRLPLQPSAAAVG